MQTEFYRCGCCDQKFTSIEDIRGHFKTEDHKQVASVALIKEWRYGGLGILLELMEKELGVGSAW